MTRLEQLLYSLTSIIVQYHDSQSTVTKLISASDPNNLRNKSKAFATNIIENKDMDFKNRLDQLINACTKEYPKRRPLLYFILHEINFLKAMKDTKKSFSPALMEEYTKQISQLLIDCRELLNTPQSKTYEIKYSKINDKTDTKVALSGLKNDSYYGDEFCNSGSLVKEDVLLILNISLLSTNDEIMRISADICTEYQNGLLVTELNAANNQLLQHIEKNQQEVILSSKKLKESEFTALEQQSKIVELEKIIENLKQRVSDLSQSKNLREYTHLSNSGYPFFGLQKPQQKLKSEPEIEEQEKAKLDSLD